MSKIYENSLAYLISKKYVNWSFKKFYKEVIVIGKENIPINKPVIFAPNHLNALMDALAILSLPPFRQVKVYLSRADIFKLPKPIVKFIHFTKIMPAYRMRDGFENLSKNKESFSMADEVLLNGACMCMMPEGDQGLEHKIRPLVKGIFRIAFSAQQKMTDGKSVQIIPVGLNYGDFVKQGKHLIINIGKPINVASYYKDYEEKPSITINTIKNKLKEELEKLALHIDSEEYYDSFLTMIEVTNEQYLEWLGLKNNTYNLFVARQKAAENLRIGITEQTDIIEDLDKVCKKYKSSMQKIKFDFATFNKKVPTFTKNIFNYLTFIALLILALPGILLNIIPYFITSQIPKLMKIKFEGFFSSVYYVAGIVLFPLFYLIQSLVLLSVFSIPLWYIFLALPAHYFLGKLSLHMKWKLQEIMQDIRYYIFAKSKKKRFDDLQTLRNTILKHAKYLYKHVK
ncbi:MAG: hypothetical protein BGO29_05730 [Bacteroidales bacterium 36-12]|nr:MAG: hypothetical protein BGO29_05730 [Bacteroidales bacterium 36-12]